jgi:hypothetical protein
LGLKFQYRKHIKVLSSNCAVLVPYCPGSTQKDGPGVNYTFKERVS